MRVDDILKAKISAVKMVRPDETALELAEQLRAERIGAAIVSADGITINGIISSAISPMGSPRTQASCRR